MDLFKRQVMTQPFFNTTNLTGEELKRAVTNARKCEEAVFIIYKNTRKRWTAWDIHGMMTRAGLKYPITSVRRSMTNLMNDGQLLKTSDKKPGEYDAPEHFYIINPVKHPSPTNVEQPELFG